jgi:peptide/nickel transport system permease protein
MRRRNPLADVWSSGAGRAGAVLFVFLAVVSVYVVVTFPADFGPSRWSNPAVWADNPRNAAPVWSTWFSSSPEVPHLVLSPDPAYEDGPVEVIEMPFTFEADRPPEFLTVRVAGVTFGDRAPSIVVSLHRPDGAEVTLYRQVVPAGRSGESPPFTRYSETPLRVVLGSEPQAVEGARLLLLEQFGAGVGADRIQGRVEEIIFGTLRDDGRVEVLKGEYRLEARVTLHEDTDQVGMVGGVVGGTVFGVMGTDSLGRDLFQGILFGLPVALLIGLLASTISTAIGATLGLISGFRGGRIDTLIQRAADVVTNVPVLPLLIFLVFVIGSRLWVILLVLVAFGWPGLTIVVRSMVLQIRDGTEVEAARALGASNRRIIFRHVFPHLSPFILAQLIFFAPSAILAEAGLSFLGLGDPSIPTWGQILEAGFRTGAVFLGYWWWVVPPGLAIVITALAFMLLALGTEPAVSPRLRRTV